MSDVGNVKGPGERTGPEGPKKKKGADSDAFREMMKVGKAREVDPDEKKKRKRREEVEDEAAAQQMLQPQLLPKQGIPGKEETTSFDLGLGSKGLGGAPPVPKEGAQPPSASAPGVEEAEEPSASQPPPPYTPPPEEQPPQMQQPQTQPANKNQSKRKEATEEPTKKKATPTVSKTTKRKKPAEKVGTTSLHKTETPKKPEESDAFFKMMGVEEPPKEVDQEKKSKETVVAPAPLPKGGWESIKAPEKKKDEGVTQALPETQIVPTDTSLPPPAPAVGTTSEVPPQYLNLPPQLVKLFDRMVGVMTVMTNSGIKETTITLNAPQFAKSAFFGSEITITEFSTAPLEFNIQLTGTSQAVDLFQGSAQELVAAFEAGKYNFKVNRIETAISSGVREVKRKEKIKPVKKSKEEE